MKYIVEVNAKYLVNIEADSCLNAEHKLLDYNGIWGANAFDRAALKTDTFAGAVQFDEMISMGELIEMVNEAMDAKKEAAARLVAASDAAEKVAELEAALKAAKDALKDADRLKAEAVYAYDRLEEKLGKRRN